ncbi:MAG: hypothetical protein [Caudoviricetes sp.]|nr:MAG: hypothetical protein [Caudoviricetes sp.]
MWATIFLSMLLLFLVQLMVKTLSVSTENGRKKVINRLRNSIQFFSNPPDLISLAIKIMLVVEVSLIFTTAYFIGR